MSLPKKIIEVIADGRITIPIKFRGKLGIKKGSFLLGYIVKDKLVLEVLEV